MPKQLTSEDFEYIYKKAPRLCVDLVVKNDEGVLLTLRDIPPAKGYWHLPGGTIMHGEPLEDAAKRIAQSELGVKIEVEKQLGILEYFGKHTNFGHSVSAVILVQLKYNKIKLDRQASEFGYFKNIPSNTIKEVREFLKNL